MQKSCYTDRRAHYRSQRALSAATPDAAKGYINARPAAQERRRGQQQHARAACEFIGVTTCDMGVRLVRVPVSATPSEGRKLSKHADS